ncbi:hypothetical protein ACE38W_01570 [Chitinophaga sp. Hz27]|uniref:hypothetical protein n=1 Tax=Chitinophaga sp. Hz27 TaxID=3347169 RepID=UPI0035DBC91E
MFKYYRWCVVFPPILTIVLILGFVVGAMIAGHNWLNYKTTTGAGILMVILLSIILGVLFLPVFLNNRADVRENAVKRFLSWWLLPGTWFIYLLLNGKGAAAFFDGSMYCFFLVGAVMHIAGSVAAYVMFDRDLKEFMKEYGRHDA